MEEKKREIRLYSILAIVICIGIAAAAFSPLVPYIGFLAYPLIIGGGVLLGKATEQLWFKGNKY